MLENSKESVRKVRKDFFCCKNDRSAPTKTNYKYNNFSSKNFANNFGNKKASKMLAQKMYAYVLAQFESCFLKINFKSGFKNAGAFMQIIITNLLIRFYDTFAFFVNA